MLQTEDFHYHLPEELIATSPLPNREASKLLVLEQDNLIDDSFKNLLRYLKSGDLLVLNNSKVIKARLFGKKTTGAKVEVLVERILDNHSIVAHVKTNKTISTHPMVRKSAFACIQTRPIRHNTANMRVKPTSFK